MLRLLCKELLQQLKKNPNPNGTASIIKIYAPSLQAPFTTRTITAAAAAAAAEHQQQPEQPSSPTISYLINACGLSPEAALSAAELVKLKTTENPDSVLRLLREFGCTDADISTIVAKRPMLLSTRPDRTLRPKLDFLLCANPDLLRRSLEKKIIPSFRFLEGFLPAGGGAISDVLKFSTRINLQFQLPNIETLRRHGVSDANISRMLATRPGSLMRNPHRFEEIVAAVKEMGVDPENPMFSNAVGVMSFMCKSTWERKVAVYQSLGWSEGEIVTAFRKQPTCLGMSDERIRQKIDFYTDKLGWSPGFVSRLPMLMMISFEKRVLPRCSVLNVLMSRGVLKKKVSVCSALMITEKKFLQRYVTKYAEEIPEVVDAHQGKVNFVGWDVGSEEQKK